MKIIGFGGMRGECSAELPLWTSCTPPLQLYPAIRLSRRNCTLLKFWRNPVIGMYQHPKPCWKPHVTKVIRSVLGRSSAWHLFVNDHLRSVKPSSRLSLIVAPKFD